MSNEKKRPMVPSQSFLQDQILMIVNMRRKRFGLEPQPDLSLVDLPIQRELQSEIVALYSNYDEFFNMLNQTGAEN